ncbi:hypothetical protein Tco_0685212 [Tanacetum coccineum]
MSDSTGVLTSLGGEISSGGKKSQESNSVENIAAEALSGVLLQVGGGEGGGARVGAAHEVDMDSGGAEGRNGMTSLDVIDQTLDSIDDYKERLKLGDEVERLWCDVTKLETSMEVVEGF